MNAKKIFAGIGSLALAASRHGTLPESHGSTRYFSRMQLSYYHGWQRTRLYSFDGRGWTGGP